MRLLTIWRIARWPLVAVVALGLRAFAVSLFGDGRVAEVRVWSNSDGCRVSFTREHGPITNSTKADTECNSDREFDGFRVRCLCTSSP